MPVAAVRIDDEAAASLLAWSRACDGGIEASVTPFAVARRVATRFAAFALIVRTLFERHDP